MAHLELPEEAAALVIAPATAEMLSQLARGAAGDIISASTLAMPRAASGQLKAPVFIAPAMHEAMWTHPATQDNLAVLKVYGYQLMGPERGALGRADDAGWGRMSDPEVIASTVLQAIKK
jgi:phosphopantothenoylcysteine decarboxylase/phosphopantothenate--cysteine ligase